jgi:hypothetical protein
VLSAMNPHMHNADWLQSLKCHCTRHTHWPVSRTDHSASAHIHRTVYTLLRVGQYVYKRAVRHRQVLASVIVAWVSVERWWADTERVEKKYREENLSNATLSIRNPT